MTTPGHEDNQGMSLYIVLYDYDPKLVGLKTRFAPIIVPLCTD